MQTRFHAIVHGQVQMVGFRYFVAEQAAALKIRGWVRNGEGGTTVEVVAVGADAVLRQLETALRKGPPLAHVDRVDIDWQPAPGGNDSGEFADFQIRF